ncbi:hypothetical protein HKBW3S44_01436 [Candidatus Hakubella thermalkaliphila]|uniref:Uncharacterized protein n=1 Tax=Candidatus Hakubella thermalkaliphila TaxID=2754717 RepID=A0A6V8Q2Y3_9ACTN|nr:hypothetical protein [Actinomycetota bacterium]GFP37756.1 hypothetical protein HKBW3S44_01436 [Candidatus Hakubella thermalkaliphila]
MILYSPGAVEPADEGKTFLAAPWIPSVGGLISINISGFAIAITWANSCDNPIFHIGPQKAVMGIVRSTQKVEGRVVSELIAVDLLPTSLGVRIQRVIDLRDKLQRGKL